MQELVFLSLGSNVGAREDLLRTTLARLAECGIETASCSSLYETEPVDVRQQPFFLNLACQVRTMLNPQGLLSCCRSIEASLGRTPGPPKGPRKIDIDILFYGDLVFESKDLSIPHPSLPARRFVLEPLAEIAPEFCHPVRKLTVRQLLDSCPDTSRVTRLSRPGFRT